MRQDVTSFGGQILWGRYVVEYLVLPAQMRINKYITAHGYLNEPSE